MDAEIQEGLALAEALMHGTDHLVTVLDSRGIILAVNEAAARRAGKNRLSLVGSGVSDLFPPAVASKRMAVFERVKESGKTERFEDEDEGICFDHIVYPVPGSDGKAERVVVITSDVTDRRRAEKELRSANRKLERLAEERASFLSDILEKAADGISVCHNIPEEPYVRFTHWNRRMTEITGYTIDEINALGWYQSMYPDPEYQRRAVERMARMREGRDIHAEEWVVTHRSGQKRTLSISTSVLKREQASVHVLAVMQDVTDRKRVEEVRESIRRRVDDVQQIARIGDWEWDVETGRVTWSREVHRIFGLEPEKNPSSCDLARSLVHPEDMSMWEEAVAKAVRESDYFKLDYRAIRPDGSVIWIHNDAKILRKQNGTAFKVIGTAQDVTERKEAEEALKASEKRYRDLITNMREVLYTLDITGRITFVSPSVETLTQYRDLEIIGHPIEDLVFKDDLPRLYQNLQKILSGTRESEGEYRLLTKSGEMRWFWTRSSAQYEGSEIIGAQGILSDITERKRSEEALRESEEKFRSLVETTSDRIWETDTQGIYTFVSPQVRDLLGYEPEEVLGRNPFEFMPPDESARMKAKLSRIAKERRAFVGVENVNIKKDGRRVVLETSAVPRLDGQGNFLGYRGIDRDITDRKNAEELLRRSHDELEYRVAQRTAQLERKNRELQEFAYVAAHDLREPLRKIQTFGSYLSTKKADRLDGEGKDYILRMTYAANRMQELLDALLRYTRIETNGQQFIATKLDDVAREVIGDLEVGVRKIGANVEVGPLPIVMGDPNQLRQLFQNLVANALKYHRTEVIPRIKIHAEEDHRACRIFVEDNGIGFDEKYLDKIFQPFQRLHGKREYPGLGIGLAICKKIVDSHGGTITATSTLGKGSRFVVTLPVNREPR